MSKEEYYSKIKKVIYRKFNELEVIERDNGNDIYLRYKNDDYAKILVKRNSGEVIYCYRFRSKILKPIPIEKRDFEILLSRWAEDKFKIKANYILILSPGSFTIRLKIPPK